MQCISIIHENSEMNLMYLCHMLYTYIHMQTTSIVMCLTKINNWMTFLINHNTQSRIKLMGVDNLNNKIPIFYKLMKT